MYRTVIELKKEIEPNMLEKLKNIASKHYDNRAGKVDNSSTNPFVLVFEGIGEAVYGCLDLGTSTLARTDFLDYVKSWEWIDDEDPFENCDVYQLYTARRLKNAKKADCI